MKKQFIVILTMIIFSTACSVGEASPQTEPPAIQDPSESLNVQEPDNLLPQIQSENSPEEKQQNPVNLFVVPEIECDYADELLEVVQGFSREYSFPKFESLDELDFESRPVSSNLYDLTVSLNDELLALERGVTHKKREEIMANDSSVYSLVRLDDMNEVGRRYFGKEFSFPKGLVCEEIAPLDSDSEYYKWTNARGGMSFFYYLLTDVIQNNNEIIVTFLPYSPNINWHNGTIETISFNNPKDEMYYYVRYDLGYFKYPSDEARENADVFSCLQYYYLTVPQEQLGTITVTFRRENDGRLIAASCRYNRD